jgi:hypothetical protein
MHEISRPSFVYTIQACIGDKVSDKWYFSAGFRIRIRIVSGFNQVSGSGSVFAGKNYPQK